MKELLKENWNEINNRGAGGKTTTSNAKILILYWQVSNRQK